MHNITAYIAFAHAYSQKQERGKQLALSNIKQLAGRKKAETGMQLTVGRLWNFILLSQH